MAEICKRVESLDLFPEPPATEVSRRYRVWAFESALLDLALRQAGRSLAQALDTPARAMRYVCSTRLGEPPTLDPVRRRLELDGGLRFKLDATSSWTPELVGELVATGAVDSVDFKGFYRGTVVDQPADPILYRRIAEAFPDAWLEDPDLSTPEAAAALHSVRDRITWDAPIHSVADIEALEFAPRMVNIKPSRIGAIRDLFATYEYCDARGSAPTVAARPSLARAAVKRSTWRRCSIQTAPTTWLHRPTTRLTHRPGSRRARSDHRANSPASAGIKTLLTGTPNENFNLT